MLLGLALIMLASVIQIVGALRLPPAWHIVALGGSLDLLGLVVIALSL